MDTVRHIRIFLASPGDVLSERRLAFKVIERLEGKPWARNRVKVETVAWDAGSGPALVATLTPQEAINRGLPKPSACDIVVTILWSRLGTPLPPEYKKPDGTLYASGTEWEFLDAVQGWNAAQRPIVLLYRRKERISFDPDDGDYAANGEQWNLVKSFFEAFRGPEGSLRGGVNDYASPSEFEAALDKHLEQIVYTDILGLDTGGGPPDTGGDAAVREEGSIRWDGSPYPGLVAFEQAQAAIFFGRGRDVDRLYERLMDPRAGFLAVIGTSGSGKSSLVRAGLLPRIETVHPDGWKIVTFTPDELGTRDPFASVAAALLKYDPALRRPELGTRLAAGPDCLADLLEETLGHAGAHGFPRALVFVDQFEEVFTTVAEPHREPLLRALVACAKRDRIQVIVTLRSDFYTHAVAQDALIEMLEQGTVPLGPAGVGALLQMIEEPARLAGIRIEQGLAERIISDTGTEPGALALMAYALSELYRRGRDARRLTIADYDALGGVTGALATRCEAIFTALDDEARQALSRIARELVEVDERGTATRLRAPLGRFEEDPAAQRLCATFVNERLFVAGEGLDGRPYVEVAHEAILRSWERLADWIDEHREDLRLWRRVTQAAREWDAHRRAPYYLWPYERLAGVSQAQSRLAITVDDPVVLDFIRPEWQRLLEELDAPGVPSYRRSAILARLAEIGEPALPAAIRALAHADPGYVDEAVRQVMRSFEDSTRRMAAKLLASPRGEERLGAARALLVLGDPESVEMVAEYERSAPNADAEEPADGPSELEVRTKIAESAYRDPAFSSVLVAAMNNPSPRVRDQAIQSMRWARGAGFATAWKAVLSHEAPAVRDLGFRMLKERDGADAIPALVEILRTGSPEDREQAEDAIDALGSGAASALVEVLSAGGGPERVVLIRALARIGDASRDGVFVELFADPDAAVRAAAIDGVRRVARQSWERFADTGSLSDRLDDPSAAVRAGAALALAAFDHRESIPRVVTMLDDAEPPARAAAAESIGQLAIASPDDRLTAAIDRLAALLDDADEAVRGAVALALGRLGHEPAASRITSLLDDQSSRVRADAAAAFQHLRPAPFERLVRALEDTDPSVVAAAIRALGAAGHVLESGYRPFLERTEPAIRGAAAFAAGRVGEVAATPHLVRLLGDVPECREAATAALRELRDRHAVARLVGLLDAADEDVRVRAVSLLGDLGGAPIVRRLIPRLDDSAWPVRSAAAEALRKLADGSSVQELIAALGATSDSSARLVLADLLGELGDPSAVPDLAKVLDSDPGSVASRAAAALSRLIDDPSALVLGRLLEDEDPQVRRTGIETLQRLDGPGAGARIGGFLTDPAPRVRAEAATALGKIDARDQIGSLVAALDDTDDQVQAAAITALASLNAVAAAPRIAALAADAKAPNRTSATSALGKVGSEADAALLVAMLDEDGNDVRQAALEALGGIAMRKGLSPPTTHVAIERLRPLLEDPEAQIWTRAGATLAALSDTATVLTLLPRLADEHGPHRWQIERALGGIHIDEPSDELLGLLTHESAAVRARAIRMFAPAGRAALLQRLLEAGTDPHWSVQSAAVEAFEHYRTREAVAWLRQRVDGASPETRAFIVKALARIDLPESRDVLLGLAADPSDAVAGAAILALPPLSDASVVPFLLERGTGEASLRWYIVDALTRLPSEDLAADLVAALSAAGPEGKTLLIDALVKMAEGDRSRGKEPDPDVHLDPRAEEALLALVQHSDDAVAGAVANALRRARSESAIPALFRLLRRIPYRAGRSLEHHARREAHAVFTSVETLDETARAAAATWLADIDHTAAAEALEKLTADPDPTVRQMAIDGLTRKTGEVRSAVTGFPRSPAPDPTVPAATPPPSPSLLHRVLDALRGR